MIVVFKNISGPEGVKVLTLSANPLAQALGEIGSEVMMDDEREMLYEKR